MILHLGFELPSQNERNKELDAESPVLTPEEIRILKRQIRKNDVFIQDHIERLDLLVNKEKYPKQADFIHNIRKRLFLLMEENDTFRKVLWKHYGKSC